MNTNVAYDPQQPTPSTDHRHNSSTATTVFSIAESTKTLALSFATQHATNKQRGFGAELPPHPPIFTGERPRVSLPRLRELDIFSPAPLGPPGRSSASITQWSHPVGAPEGFPGFATPFSAARGPVPLAAYSYQNRFVLSTAATLQYQHGTQGLAPAVRGCATDRFPTGLQSVTAASRRPRRPRSQPHCNVKYSTEQVDFIAYFRGDLGLPWEVVEARYATAFPKDAKQGYRRRAPGLQGVYYRQDNKQISKKTLNRNNDSSVLKRHVRRRGKKTTGLIGLLATHPERAVNYAWVSYEHKQQCESVLRRP